MYDTEKQVIHDGGSEWGMWWNGGNIILGRAKGSEHILRTIASH